MLLSAKGGIGQSVSLFFGLPSPDKNCGFVQFSVSKGTYTSATLYTLEWSLDGVVPYTSVDNYLIADKGVGTNTGYYRVQFRNSTGNIGTPVNYSDLIIVNPDPIINTSLN